MRVASAGSTALSRGIRNLPRCIMIFFLPDRGSRLSVTLRRTALRLRSLRAKQSHNLTLPFSTFSTHSQMLCTSSLSQYETMAFRSLVVAVLSTWRA